MRQLAMGSKGSDHKDEASFLSVLVFFWVGVRIDPINEPPAQTNLTVIKHGALTRCDRPLRCFKIQSEAFGCALNDGANTILLTVAGFHGATSTGSGRDA